MNRAVKLEIVVVTIVLMTCECATAQTAPLPRPRPSPSSPEATSAPGAAPRNTACQFRLTPDRAVFRPLGAIDGPGECGGPDIVSLQGVITKDRLPIEISPAATLRCETAEAIVNWVREDLVGLAANLKSVLIGIETFDSFECRGQNRIVGAKLSEHGRANALDIRAIRLKGGRDVRLTAPAYVFMAAPSCSSYITGEVLPVIGGY